MGGFKKMDVNPTQVSNSGDLFGMNLYYNTAAAGLNNVPMFSGNISATEWQTVQTTGTTTPVTTGRKAYVYDYDPLSRLTNASFSDYTSGAWQASNRFNEKINAYDLNGNIKSLKRMGSFTNWATGTIDNLTYYYKGNQLMAVDDMVRSDNGYDFFDNGNYSYGVSTEYEYDANGNMTRDVNKGIVNIAYNYNNLPVEIDFLSDNKLTYLYDYAGTKLRQDVIQSKTLQKRTDFISNLVIVNNLPAWISFDEGRVIMNGSSVYFTETHLKDHLGNTRVAIGRSNNTLVVKQVNSYYPFGLNIKGLTTSNNMPATKAYQPNEYLYNGKMFQDELGLDWLDYGARFYDAQLGRWTTIDPLCEDGGQESATPYGYAFNDPIKHNDPDGRFPLLSNLVGATAGALVEYGGQIAANVFENGWSTSAFTDNIDVGDIGLAAGEGFLTSGGSIVKNALLKTTVAVGSEVARNFLDVTTSSDGTGLKVSTNDAGTTVKNTAIGLTVGKIGDVAPAPKVKVMNAPTSKQAVSKARVDAKANGTTVNRQQRIATESNAKQGQKTAASVNKTAAKTPQSTMVSGTSETIKQQTDEKR